MRSPNAFSGPYLDRAAHLRKDEAFVAQALADPATVVVPVWRSKSLVRRGPDGWTAAYLEVTHACVSAAPAGERVMLGQFDGRVYFAIDVPGDEPPSLFDDARFEDLRMIGAQLPAQEAGVLAYARGLL